jgi:uncharacterized heparinase superfamily protein
LGAPSRHIRSTQEVLEDVPTNVQCVLSDLEDGRRVELSHDGYRKTHGLVHARTLDLTLDGRTMVGEDLLTTLDEADEKRFAWALDKTSLQGVPYSLRFHIHPEADVTLDMGGSAVSMALKSGEIWIFRHDGHAN